MQVLHQTQGNSNQMFTFSAIWKQDFPNCLYHVLNNKESIDARLKNKIKKKSVSEVFINNEH